MWLIDLVLLILLGILGIASWLRSTQPRFAAQLAPLENVAGWVGLVGLVWGIVLLLRWIAAIGVFSFAPGTMLVALIVDLVILALSLILALPVLRSLLGSNAFTNRAAEVAGKLGPYKVALGFACLVLALYALVVRF